MLDVLFLALGLTALAGCGAYARWLDRL